MRLYLFAMLEEAKDILTEYELVQDKPFHLYKNETSLLAITGVGKVNASLVTSFLIGTYNITSIVNMGFVGAIGDFSIGESLIVNKALYHDFDLSIFGYEKGQVPRLPVYYESNKELLKGINITKTATLYTGDYFMTESNLTNYIADMEAVAMFQVAHVFNIPMISIKVVSDIIGSNDHIEEYKVFEKNGSKIIFEVYKKIKG